MVVLEYLAGGEVQWKRDEEPILSIRQTQRIMRDVILGLEYCASLVHEHVSLVL